MITRVNRKKMSEQIIEQLKEKIKNGEFPPDSKLPSENALAKMFGVSRAPIREALSVLTASGLVESIQGGGNFVKKVPLVNLLNSTMIEMISAEELYDLLEMRMVIETQVAAFAAERHTDEEIKEIELALEQFAETINDEQAIGDVADFQFHMSIVRAAHNKFLKQSLENIGDLHKKALRFSLEKNIGLRRKRELVYQEHLDIFEAIKSRDSEAAAYYMKKHLMNLRLKFGDPRLEVDKEK
ncbi:FadR/GntR family transcriptional regulator [Sporosarcina jiandibaonis]|uniref:FadR/GntR family transcriptional regulator n=1 Tax=Sporosarcina jiandibaonis TaxID=2715535 RepID=UPI0015546A35|nr:FadR/GntR family transcriptional regulator [Sporosarcina jiandibaonis]